MATKALPSGFYGIMWLLGCLDGCKGIAKWLLGHYYAVATRLLEDVQFDPPRLRSLSYSSEVSGGSSTFTLNSQQTSTEGR